MKAYAIDAYKAPVTLRDRSASGRARGEIVVQGYDAERMA
jgi:hypothetical protein